MASCIGAGPRVLRGLARDAESRNDIQRLQPIVWRGPPVNSWAQFQEVVKRPDRPLLAGLDDYDDSLLIAGCERSGTTAITRLFKRTPGIADCDFGHDDELDGALLLSGYVERFTSGRHCFQTTYVDDRFTEYFEHGAFRLIWLLREPRAVVYSMLHNWKGQALNRLYAACGATKLDPHASQRRQLGGWIGPSRLDKACASYVAKTEQTAALAAQLGARIVIVDYDDLITHRDKLLPQLFEFAGEPFDRELLRHLHGKSVRRGDKLTAREAAHVDEICMPAYLAARKLQTIGRGHDA